MICVIFQLIIHWKVDPYSVKAKNKVEELVMGKIVSLKLGEFDSFGRLFGIITTSDGIDVAEDLISSGLAIRYEGGKRPSWGDA